MSFLRELIVNNAEYIEVLFAMIEHSKVDPECTRMAGNAASLLTFMGVSFRNRQLQHVRICQAVMTGANLDHANFAEADLTDVKLADAWLSGTCLEAANLTGANFGVLPFLQHKEAANQIAYSANTNCLIAASGNQLYVWDMAVSRLKKTLRGHTKEVTCVAVSADGATVVSGSKDYYSRDEHERR